MRNRTRSIGSFGRISTDSPSMLMTPNLRARAKLVPAILPCGGGDADGRRGELELVPLLQRQEDRITGFPLVQDDVAVPFLGNFIRLVRPGE